MEKGELENKIHSLKARLKRQQAINKLQDKQLKRMELKYKNLIIDYRILNKKTIKQ